MKPLALALVLALAFPLAHAQTTAKQVIAERAPVPGFDVAQPVFAQMRVEPPAGITVPFDAPWLLVGHDNLVNLSVVNAQDKHLNVTFRVNASGAAVTPDVVTLHVRPGLVAGATVVVRPDDVGLVEVRAEAEDAFQPGGEPLQASLPAVSAALPSARLVDPPLSGAGEEGYQSISGYGGGSTAGMGYVLLRSGDAVTPRLELRNPLPTATPPFRATAQGNGRVLGPIDVPSMEPGETRAIEFPEHVPMERGSGPGFGGVARVEMRFMAAFVVAGVEPSVSLADYRIENGVVRDALPMVAVIDVQDGIALDLRVPTSPVLGAPTRLKYNITNNGVARATGTMVLTLQTPGSLFYEVQGPETHQVRVELAPGDRVSGAIDFTPRVSGVWSVSNFFLSSEGFGYGGGGGAIVVPGPVSIRMDSVGTVYARIGEPVRVDLSIATTRPLQGAELRVTSGATRYMDPTSGAGTGDFQPGLAQRLLRSSADVTGLDTLQPGGVLNASLEVSGRSAGRYSVIPYVLAEGFAYTSDVEMGAFRGIEGPGAFYGVSTIEIAVQARSVDAAWAIAPFVAALAFFVGTWTLRTKFVR